MNKFICEKYMMVQLFYNNNIEIQNFKNLPHLVESQIIDF